nr:hypothetical protein RAR13_09360 [Aminobacter aminovorans]
MTTANDQHKPFPVIDLHPPVAAVQKSHRGRDLGCLAFDHHHRIKRGCGVRGIAQPGDDLVIAGSVARLDLMSDRHPGSLFLRHIGTFSSKQCQEHQRKIFLHPLIVTDMER